MPQEAPPAGPPVKLEIDATVVNQEAADLGDQAGKVVDVLFAGMRTHIAVLPLFMTGLLSAVHSIFHVTQLDGTIQYLLDPTTITWMLTCCAGAAHWFSHRRGKTAWPTALEIAQVLTDMADQIAKRPAMKAGIEPSVPWPRTSAATQIVMSPAKPGPVIGGQPSVLLAAPVVAAPAQQAQPVAPPAKPQVDAAG